MIFALLLKLNGIWMIAFQQTVNTAFWAKSFIFHYHYYIHNMVRKFFVQRLQSCIRSMSEGDKNLWGKKPSI